VRPAAAQSQPVREVVAARAVPPPVIDAGSTTRCGPRPRRWAGSSNATRRRQAATEDTLVRVAYDDHALYVAAELHDREPKRIVRQLSRRDVAVDADALLVYVDPHTITSPARSSACRPPAFSGTP